MPETILGNKFYTVPEVSKLLSCSVMTVKNYIKAGRLEATKVGRRYLMPEQAVKTLLTDQTKKKWGKKASEA